MDWRKVSLNACYTIVGTSVKVSIIVVVSDRLAVPGMQYRLIFIEL